MSTFVTVGNATQPFDRLLRAVESVAALLPGPVCVQCGAGNFNAPGCEVQPFLTMAEFARRIEQSEVLIMHGGAGSLIHALDAGRTPIVMPREKRFGEHVDDHQLELAQALAGAGRVVLVRSAGELERELRGGHLPAVRASGPKPESRLVAMVAARLDAYERS